MLEIVTPNVSTQSGEQICGYKPDSCPFGTMIAALYKLGTVSYGELTEMIHSANKHPVALVRCVERNGVLVYIGLSCVHIMNTEPDFDGDSCGTGWATVDRRKK